MLNNYAVSHTEFSSIWLPVTQNDIYARKHKIIWKECCINQGNNADRTYLRCCPCQSVEKTSLLRRSEGGVLVLQCNLRGLSYRVFTNN